MQKASVAPVAVEAFLIALLNGFAQSSDSEIQLVSDLRLVN